MQQTATEGKAVGGTTKVLGWGHHNLLLIRDYVTGDLIFRAETEVRRLPENQTVFDKLLDMLGKNSTNTAEMEKILHGMVDALPTEREGPRNEEGKKRAKAIFSAALGRIP